MVSDVFITKAYELDLAQPGSRAFEEANAFIFDSRSSNSILAILLPSSSSLLLLTLSWSQTGSLVVTPLRQTYAIAATPVLATRSTILDLLILGREGNWSTLSAGAQAESITGPILSRGGGGGRRIKRVDGDRSGFFTVSFEDGSRFAAAMPSPPDGLARRILHTIAEVIPLSDYVQFWREVARCKANDPTVDYFQIIRDVLFNLFAVPSTIIEPSDSWSEFINATDGNSTSDPALSTLRSSASRLETSPVVSRTQSTTRELLEAVVLGLHLLSEDCKVLAETQQDHVKLAAVLLPLVTTLGNPSWLDAYLRKTGGALVPLAQAAVWTGPTSLPAHPPDLISSLSTLLSGRSKPPSFSLSSIAPSYNFTPSNFYGPTTPCLTTFQIIATYEALSTLSGPSTALLRAQQSVRVMSSMGWTSEFVARLVFGLGVPCREAIRMCQLEAPEGWPVEAYQLIRRPDLARQICGVGRKKSSTPKVSLWMWCFEEGLYSLRESMQVSLALFTTESICENAKSGIPPKDISVKVQSDAAPVPKATRFNEDRRLEEVARMLQYSESVTISAGDRTLDQLTPQVQQSILTALSNRTLALPIGYAMFTYRSATRPIIESVAISRINTSARILPMPSPVALVDKEPRDSPSSTTSDRLEWPEFHSGVAAALQLHPGQSGNLDSSQISFNKPADLDARHAGFLLGLGLMGRIGALIVNQAFEYLKMKHDPTSIGLLLGLAVTYLGTGDPKVTSLISVHLTALHPPNSSPLNVSGITQAAGLVGIGLLYLGTRRRTLADIMVRELCAIKVTSIEDPAACREAYALSAGFAFGLIMLGSGTESATTSNEVTLLRTFRALILGESNHPLPGATPSSNVTDVNITSSAATVAIGLTYLRTERQDVADMLEIPDTARRLDYVRSDLLLLRTLARSMILWSSISSSKIWVESHIPAFITDAFKSPQAGIKPDGDLDIARWNIVAGACFAMGLKFAGTAAAEAHSTLIHYLDRLTRAAYVKASTVQGKIKRHAIRCCLSVVAISLSMVMAGTGEINVLRRLRVAHGHFSEGVTYGTHLASHMALGLLFVGGGQYTLGTSNSAIAALVIAFFPAFPPLPTENRAHLQAYRHLWTLAIEPRCLQVRDVDTNEPTFLPIKLRLVEHADVARAKQLVAKQLVAPTLIPEIQLIDTIQIDSPRYWSFALHLRSNPDHLASFLRDATIFVKRRTGHLSYAQDPRGIRSIFTRSKSETGSSVYDFGETARMLAASATGLRDFVSAFSDDPEAIAAVAHLCHPAGSNSPPTAFEAFSASVLLECLTRDKRDTIAVYHAMYHANALLGLAKMTPTSLVALEQLRFVEGFYRRGSYRSVFGRSRSKPSAGRDPLLQLAFVEHVASTLSNRAKTLVADPSLASYARKYLATSKWPVDQDAGRALSVVLSVQDAPDSTSLQILRGYALGMIQRVRMGDEAVDLLAVLTLMVHGTGQAAEDLGGRAWQQDFTALAVDVWMGMST
ncbi:anaphase-promoting complex subunit 1, partial [Phenoliferia sp. Uapishka_3]